MLPIISFALILFLLPLLIYNVLPVDIKKRISAVVKLLYTLFHVNLHALRYNGKKFAYVDEVELLIDRFPDRVQFISVDEDRKVTLAEFDMLANQVAWWLVAQGVKQRDTVALMMLNRPEFVSFWVGCAKIGVTCSLLNTNNTGKPLTHSVNLSLEGLPHKILVVDSELKDQLSSDIKDLEASGVKVVFWNDAVNDMQSVSIKRPPKDLRSTIKERDPLILIFTSGTTGLPKASKISQSRFIVASWPYVNMASLTPTDVIYTAMPLYHSAAGMLGVGSSLRSGATLVIRKKFSVRAFTSDCVKYQCTSMLYIGELCRYLLSAPPSSEESKLKLRTAFGNGMRPEVWTSFQTRYNIKNIIEFYSATEGNIGLFNPCDKVGALGYIPRIADAIYPVTLVRPDPDDKSMPYRNKLGLCEHCKPDEVGLLIGPVDNKRVDRRFDGYTDVEATKKKVLVNVFKQGDCYFNTGDLLTRDKEGFYYWSDRVGDTFRWKAENVATSEVGEILAACNDIADVTVYGVQVPGCDGRAGMAAIVLKETVSIESIDWTNIMNELSLHLPTYARPLFFRIKDKLETTSTFKHLKGNLVKEGFSPDTANGDALFFHYVKDKKMVPLTKEVYNDISTGKIADSDETPRKPSSCAIIL